MDLSQAVVENWGAPAALPAIPYVSVHSSEEERAMIEEEYQKENDDWAIQEYLRPVQLQFQLTEFHNDAVHENAFQFMRNSTDLPFASDSEHFSKAYAGFYSRMEMPRGCCAFSILLSSSSADRNVSDITRMRQYNISMKIAR